MDIKKLYKGALLHVHFSGMVRSAVLLDAAWKIRDKIAFNNNMLFYVGKKCPYKANFAAADLERCREIVREQWAATGGDNLNEDFGPIGALFYHLIKHVDFYPTYMQLILFEMNEQIIDYVELRLSLGKMFEYTGRMARDEPEKNFLPIRAELLTLIKCRENFAAEDKYFNIIAQFSKAQAPHVVERKLNLVREGARGLEKIVVAVDIVGDEISGRPLADFAAVLKASGFALVLHAGEQFRDFNKTLKNIATAIELTKHQEVRRIGHGLYYFANETLRKKIVDLGYVLEFCPESLKMFKNLQSADTISQFMSGGAAYCINSDDPNKIYDKDLNDNFNLAAANNLNLVKTAVKNSIDAAFCGNELKLKMLTKWSTIYG